MDALIRRYRLAGEVLVAKGDRVLLHRGYGTIRPDGGPAHKAGQRWRLASITKQVTAVGIMQMVAKGDLKLDLQLQSLNGVTIRMLLTHHSGQPNPDNTPKDAAGVPAFYTAVRADGAAEPDPGFFCKVGEGTANAPFSYNNCDYVFLGDLVRYRGADGPQYEPIWPGAFATPATQLASVPGFVGGRPEPAFRLSNWGGAGGLIGTARAVFDFNRALMTGKLLPPAALAELWKPEGNGSYQALGQWVFPGQLKGCAKPKRIVQRDGEIWGVQARNFILPNDDLVVIVFTNRSADDSKLGEVWEGKGFTHDLLSAAAC